LSKRLIRFSQVGLDLLLLIAAFGVSFMLRFDFSPPTPMVGRLLLTGPYVVLFEYLVLVSFGVHRFSWRYIGLREGARIFLASSVSSGVLVASRLIAGELQYDIAYLRHGVIPLGVLASNFALSVLLICGVRIARRMLGEHLASNRLALTAGPAVRTLLVGAGEAGVLVARELRSRPDLSLRAVGFVDDDPRKIGTMIYGIPVIGATAQLPALCVKHRAKQVLVTMANVPGTTIRRIVQLCETAEIPVKIIPGVYEIVGGKLNLARIRDVAIDDLLRREKVDLDFDELGSFVTDKVVLVTGAGGSIGSELCRQLHRFRPSRLVLAERSENALFHIHRELAALGDVEILPCIADVTDAPRMRQLFADNRPTLVFHAAAHKHVPIVQWNAAEGVKNNVFGTRLVADLAREHDVQAFVMISTDKAVNPTSVMGATKRAAELYVQSLADPEGTRFVTVRFGNVLGSAGSVVPIFREQIAQGGPITITHPDMRRYFMTIPEACQLVLQAGAMGEGGEIFVLDMGEPVRIVDLAKDLIALSGLKEGEDVEIQFTGIRPGEKLFEELATDAEHAEKTRHPKIFVGHIEHRPRADVLRSLATLETCIAQGNEEALLSALRRMVPEYGPSTSVASEPRAEVVASEPTLSVPVVAQ
jgi:FlaA1/EpsC-like NDP-sugar epimerase